MRDEQFYLKAVGTATVFIGLIVFVASAFRNPTSNFNTQNANGTRTALALTEQLFYGLFSTATGTAPTATYTAVGAWRE